MRVLVTGARGFVGKNLCEALKNVRDGKDRRERYRPLLPLEVWECGRETPAEVLDAWCASCDFVFHLAGVNRPRDPGEYGPGNLGPLEALLASLERHGNSCPVMLASSAQATLRGRYAGSAYGQSKLAAERLLFEREERTGAEALVYRLPNLYGKWCRPRYNSAVATFCDAIANGRPFRVDDPSTELELLYIDDLVSAMLGALLGEARRCRWEGGRCVPDDAGRYRYAPGAQRATLGEIVGLLESFRDSRQTLSVPDLTEGSLSKKLWSTFLSYYGPGGLAYDLRPNVDARGSFTEFLRTPERGQVSVNVSRPGVTKGNHWHMSKWEKFLVVSGEASIRLRKVGTDADGNPFPVIEYVVSGERPQVVEMIPGYTHNITNLSNTADLVTLMWANEPFDPTNPDTFAEEV